MLFRSYVGEINREQLKNSKYEKYKMGDMLGLSGLESFYDTELRGEDGMVYILTDSRGKQKEVRGRLEPKAGSDVVLTIDFRLQKYAEHLMERYKYNGVIISIVPKTGEILCMTSKPDYNLNYFSGKINAKEWKRLLRDKYNPLSNRVTQGIYSPGSIFKIAVGSGGLNERIVDVNDAFFCDGLYWIKTWPYKCWRPTGHGWVSFYKAVEQSCDIYFYKLGLKMKIELLYKYAKVFGLGEKTGIDLAGEKKGLVPSREWKSNVQKSTWFPGNTVMMSIGQGYLTANPLQVLNLVEAIANGGYTMQPHLMKAITMPGRKIIRLNTPKKLFDVQYPAPGNPSLAELIKTSIKGTKIKLDDEEWGLDHGTWSVLTHIYPMAAIPVVQMSLDMTKSSEYHFKLGQELNALRAEGVLIT